MRDLVVIKGRIDLDFLHQAPQPGPEDNPGVGLNIPTRPNHLDRFFDLVMKFKHYTALLYKTFYQRAYRNDPPPGQQGIKPPPTAVTEVT